MKFKLPRFYYIYLIFVVFIAVAVVRMCGQNLFEDLNDEFIRLNPEFGQSDNDFDIDRKFPFIDYDNNYIEMNGDTWTMLTQKLFQSKMSSDFTIVHIGDSHIQADGNTGTTRKLFQQEYGDAGRGLVIPFKLAGTNEPRDYAITSPARFRKAVLLRRPWAVDMGFTGIALHPESDNFSFNVSSQSPCGYFTVLGKGDFNVTSVTSGEENIPFQTEKTKNGVQVSLQKDCKEFTVSLTGDDADIYGFDLRNDNNGVIYHAIGNNGATFASYNGIPDFGESIAALSPDLVIISLGTNEAFGNINATGFTNNIASLVKKIRQASPGVKILLVTPSECQKSVSNGRSRSYQINRNVAEIRNLIMAYGRKNHIPVYDFYTVAGGEGASNHWLDEKLLSSDRIHRTWAGYQLDGILTHQALRDALTLDILKK